MKGPYWFIGVVGSRERNSDEDKAIVFDAIGKLIDKLKARSDDHGIALVSGGCRKYNRSTKKYEPCGADGFAEAFAQEVGTTIIVHFPELWSMDPDKHGRWEYARVCYERNALIAKDSDFLIACVRRDRKGGTEDTISKFVKKWKSTEKNLVETGRLILC